MSNCPHTKEKTVECVVWINPLLLLIPWVSGGVRSYKYRVQFHEYSFINKDQKLVYAMPHIHSFTCTWGFALCIFNQLYSLEIFLYGYMQNNCFLRACMVEQILVYLASPLLIAGFRIHSRKRVF